MKRAFNVRPKKLESLRAFESWDSFQILGITPVPRYLFRVSLSDKLRARHNRKNARTSNARTRARREELSLLRLAQFNSFVWRGPEKQAPSRGGYPEGWFR